MGERKAETFKRFRATSVCEECNRPYPVADVRQWYEDHKRSVEQHNDWHKTASPEELERHEEDEAFSRAMAEALTRSILDNLRPGSGPLTHSFGGD